MPYVDLAFCLNGSTIPVDHGYALYAVLCRIIPEIHEARNLAVHPIRGIYSGDGRLQMSDWSRLVLRLPNEGIRSTLKLAGKRLELDGHPLSVGVPEVRTLRPVARLRARLVTIKGYLQEDEFLAAARRQLEQLGVRGLAHLGARRTFRLKDKQVVGFEMGVTQLTAEESLTLQEQGLGGRRKMGCGVFVPWGD